MTLAERLEQRFKANMNRHGSVSWSTVEAKLNAKILKIVQAMEDTGGEPDVVTFDHSSRDIYFVDCAIESPSGRRSLCYDEAALIARKENKPRSSALQIARDIGVEVLNPAQYTSLQSLFPFDLKTSSWIATPDPIRKLGGALFGDRRYDHVFTYHNGAESYYAARGFRGLIKL